MSLAQEEVPEAELLCFDLEILNRTDDRLPALFRISGKLRVGDLDGGETFLLDTARRALSRLPAWT